MRYGMAGRFSSVHAQSGSTYRLEAAHMDEQLRRRIGIQWIDLLVAVAAIIISCASLTVTISEGRTQERLLQASTWPLVNLENSNQSGSERAINFSLQNSGVGPARIAWLTIDYLGKPARNAMALLESCCGAGLPRSGVIPLVSAPVSGYALGRDQTLTFFELPQNARTLKLFNILDRLRFNLHFRACYCSVLEDCWLLDSRSTTPAPVRDCSGVPQNAYRSGG